MNKIEQTYLIAGTPAQVWRALTDPAIIERWSGADAIFEPEVGVEYSLWGGSITGHIVEVVSRKRLVQTWKPTDWKTEDSVVTFTLTPVGQKTRVDLLHENVEPEDYDGTDKGWNEFYLGAIKRMFNTKPAKEKKIAKKKLVAKRVTPKPKTTVKRKTTTAKKK